MFLAPASYDWDSPNGFVHVDRKGKVLEFILESLVTEDKMKYTAVLGVLGDIRLYEYKDGWTFVAYIVRTSRRWKAFDACTRRVLSTGAQPYETVAMLGIDAVNAVENPASAVALHDAA
jgi:hypothetical protein